MKTTGQEGFLNILTTMFKSISGGLLDSQVVYRRLQTTCLGAATKGVVG